MVVGGGRSTVSREPCASGAVVPLAVKSCENGRS